MWEQDDDHVLFNRYRTGIRTVVHGTEELPARQVRRVVRDPDPHRAFWREAADLISEEAGADAWCRLAEEASSRRLKGLARHALVQALLRDPEHAGALKILGRDGESVREAHPGLNRPLAEKLQEYLGLQREEDLKAAFKELEELGCPWPRHYLERARRSAGLETGCREDRALTLRAERVKGTYTLFVPEDYDPLVPAPLVVGLHGGGRGGKDGKDVVGSGSSAMNFYQAGAARRGWLVVCPTAVQAPWSARPNEELLLTVLEEVKLLYNVDENRIYLTGHSMGGFGAWHFGPRHAHLWAAVAPMAGGGAQGLARLQETRTGVYLYHGADDPVVSCAGDRAAAERMLDRDMDFVYAEVPGAGHGFPREVAAEMWAFFEVRRLAVTPRRGPRGRFRVTQSPHSSFLAPPTREELRYLGPLKGRSGKEAGENDPAALLRNLRAGGGLAEKAVSRLGARKDARTASAVARVLADATASSDVRVAAARVLGLMARPEGRKALARALLEDDLDLVGEAAASLGRCGDPADVAAFGRGTRHLLRSFEASRLGRRMHYTDFAAHLKAAERMARSLAACGGEGAAAVLDQLARGLLLTPVAVRRLARAGHFPERLRRGFAGTLVSACEELGDPGAIPLLEALAGVRELGVTAECRRVISGLEKP